MDAANPETGPNGTPGPSLRQVQSNTAEALYRPSQSGQGGIPHLEGYTVGAQSGE